MKGEKIIFFMGFLHFFSSPQRPETARTIPIRINTERKSASTYSGHDSAADGVTWTVSRRQNNTQKNQQPISKKPRIKRQGL